MIISYNLFPLIGAGFVGVTAGMIGVFCFLKKQSMLGDTLSHAAMPGFVSALLLTESKQTNVLLLGALISCGIGALAIHWLKRVTNLKQDTILGTILSLSFGVGIILLSVLQKKSLSHQGILNMLFLGNTLFLLPEDMYTIIIVSSLVIISIILFWKEFKIISFDYMLAHTSGFNTEYWSLLLVSLTLVTIVISLQTMGIILTSSILIAPAVAARLWCYRLESMTLLAAFLGGFCSVAGVYASSYVEHLSPGPTIVMLLSLVLFLSLIAQRVMVKL